MPGWRERHYKFWSIFSTALLGTALVGTLIVGLWNMGWYAVIPVAMGILSAALVPSDPIDGSEG